MTKFQSERNNKSFERMLDTNYKYSCLVTLAMNTAKYWKLYELTNEIADRNNIARQKSYAIVVLRLAIILRETNITVEDLFKNLLKDYDSIIVGKYKVTLEINQLEKVKQKCVNDLNILKIIFNNQCCDYDQLTDYFLNLYRRKFNQDGPTTRQFIEAQNLSQLVISVIKNRPNYKLASPYQKFCENQIGPPDKKNQVMTIGDNSFQQEFDSSKGFINKLHQNEKMQHHLVNQKKDFVRNQPKIKQDLVSQLKVSIDLEKCEDLIQVAEMESLFRRQIQSHQSMDLILDQEILSIQAKSNEFFNFELLEFIG